MSFGSISSLPEVSGQQAEGDSAEASGAQMWSASGAFRLSHWAHGARYCSLPGALTASGSLSGL